ncbi:unnamed protein product [Gongylonema pulchrum]|uniref:Cytochrome c oxidase assembly protein COX11, mitochondrial n=1 Tax=Gongylonema pulchrum TaxID=637853 RepID=A0A3P7QQG6_9BILA|nr:unnamed protein product [Gongylonema pulchrum]
MLLPHCVFAHGLFAMLGAIIRASAYGPCCKRLVLASWIRVPPVEQPCRTFTNWTRRYVQSKNTMYYWGSVGFAVSTVVSCAESAAKAHCVEHAARRLPLVHTRFQVADDLERVASMEKIENRLIRVAFNADLESSMKWQFKPLQKEIYVHPGETALVFYSAYNPTDKPIVGISTYNIIPFQAAYYFNKIQCFCFEDQILNPGEQVDLPVFFYIDPEYVNDPDLEYTEQLLLNYTFFESKSGLLLPDPLDPENRPTIKRSAEPVDGEAAVLKNTQNLQPDANEQKS